jgi:hypothetical protein
MGENGNTKRKSIYIGETRVKSKGAIAWLAIDVLFLRNKYSVKGMNTCNMDSESSNWVKNI